MMLITSSIWTQGSHCLPEPGWPPTKKRNGVVREFEAGGNTVLLAGTGTLNRGITINGANHVIILNLEWSPEATLQAEDRCHRPGQTRDVYVHYVLCAGTIDEQMWELINAKAAAQRAVFDKEALYKSVEEVMAEAVSAQMQVAQAMIEVEREPLPELVQVEPISDKGNGKVTSKQLTMSDMWQRHGAQKANIVRHKTKQVVVQQLSLFQSQPTVTP